MKILVVDDHPLVRTGITSTIGLEFPEYEIKEASNIEDALKIKKTWAPDIMMVDICLGEENGIDLIEQVKHEYDKTKTVILTSSYSHENYFRARSLGIDGYILKDAFIDDIVYALKVIQRGKRYIDPEILRAVDHNVEALVDYLTEREKEVLIEVAEGHSNRTIAEKLYISEFTVKKHISSILAKLRLKNRTEAAIYSRNLYSQAGSF